MIVFAGLGNPGSKYCNNRHNIGFMAVDEIVRRHGFSGWRSRFQGVVAEGRFGTEKILVLKPQTFMNESGRAVGELLRFYNLQPDRLIVFHDELDLPPGKLRTKTGGGHSGNNGLRSIIAHVGSDFHRVRMGIGHPGHKHLVTSYVLRDFARADRGWLEPLIDAVADHAGLLAERKFSSFQNKVHLASHAGDAPDGDGNKDGKD